MTKGRLKKLKALIREAEHLQSEIDEVRWFPGEPVADSAKDYSTGFPRTITLRGYGRSDYAELRQKLYGKLRDIQSEIAFLEEWLDSVDDPELRDILRLHYVNGLTQDQIAAELGYSERTVRRRLRKFWEDHEKSETCP